MEEYDLLRTLMIFTVLYLYIYIYIIFADILGSCKSSYMKSVFKILFPTLNCTGCAANNLLVPVQWVMYSLLFSDKCQPFILH